MIKETVENFEVEFTKLWETERVGILYPKLLFEDQGYSSKLALDAVLRKVFKDSIGFCGIEMHRRCLSLAHNADFEEIEDTRLRAKLEARNLMMGRELILNVNRVKDVQNIINLAKEFNGKDIL